MKPGCFAAASVFAHDSSVCQGCQVFQACSAESLKTLEAIKSLVNVSDLLKRHDVARKLAGLAKTTPQGWTRTEEGGLLPPPGYVVQAEVTQPPPVIDQPVERKTQVDKVMYAITHEQEAILATMPVKPQEQARRLCSANLIDKVKAELQEGRNALSESKPRFIAVAVDRLIAGGFSRSDLKAFYVQEFGWGESTASSHVSIVCPILTAFSIAQEINGRLVLSPGGQRVTSKQRNKEGIYEY